MDKAILGTEEKEKIVYEFDGFRVDPVRRLLSRHGEPVQVTPKALSILVALLERPGEVIDKRDLIEKAWPGTIVTEANLTQNVFSLRKSLGERANENRYVVTVPGQGYSFAGEVRRIERMSTSEIPIWVDPPEAAGASAVDRNAEAESAPIPENARSGATPSPPNHSPQTVGTGKRRRRSRAATSLAVAGMLVTVMAVGAGLFGLVHLSGGRRNPTPKRPMRPAVAVLDFQCLSPRNDARWLQTALTEMLTTELASGGALRVIQGDVVVQNLRSLDIQDPAHPGPAELKQLREALGVDLVVVGSYVPLGDELRLDLRVLEVPDGSTVASVSVDGSQPQLFELVMRTGTELRKELEIPLPSPRQMRQARALAPSGTEAQRSYAEGLRRLRAYDSPGALKFLQQAVAVDPDSPVVHSALAQAWSLLGYDANAEQEARKALDLAGSLSRVDRLAIEGRLYRASKQWDKASETYRSLWTFFPDEIEYGLLLVNSLTYGGRAAEAADAIAALRKLPPPAGLDPRIDLAEAANASRLTDLASQIRAARRAEAKGRESGQWVVVADALIAVGGALEKMGSVHEAIPAFRESAVLAERAGYQWGLGRAKANLGRSLMRVGDLDGAQKACEEALAVAQRTGSAIGIAFQLTYLGWLQRDRGHLAEALSLLDQARESSVRIGDRFLEAQALNNAGEVLVAMGDLAGARQRFERALALSQAIGNRAAEARARANLGAVLAFQGDLTEARRRHQESADVLSQTGDASAAASASAAAAEMAARLGDLREAWQQSSQALAAKRRSGDRIGVGRILGSHAWLAYEMGDLAASRQLAGEQLQIARETGARSLLAWGLHNRGRAELAAGELAAARASLSQALAESSASGEGLRAMEIRLDLAKVAVATSHTDEAAALASEAEAWFRARGIRCRQSLASALLAEARVRQGRLREARAAAAVARERLADIKDRGIHRAIVKSLERCGKAVGAGVPPAIARVPAT
jgi:eukaryotic-like serine/threonine-protein kinase